MTTENLRDATKLSLPSSKIIRFRLDLNEIENAGENPNNETNATFQASFDHFTKDISIELPTINQKFLGRNYKYAYGVALPFTDPTPGKFYDRIKKIVNIYIYIYIYIYYYYYYYYYYYCYYYYYINYF